MAEIIHRLILIRIVLLRTTTNNSDMNMNMHMNMNMYVSACAKHGVYHDVTYINFINQAWDLHVAQ